MFFTNHLDSPIRLPGIELQSTLTNITFCNLINLKRQRTKRTLVSPIQSFSALKRFACARAQRSEGNFERRTRSIFWQSCALARAQ